MNDNTRAACFSLAQVFSRLLSNAEGWSKCVPRAAARTSASAFTSAKDALSRLIEQEPLVVGGIGLAIGVGLAGAFPGSAFERSLVDEVAPGAQRARADAVEAVTTRAQGALEAMSVAAHEEGLTLSAAKNSLHEVGAKIGRVVQASKESIHREEASAS